MFKIKFLLKYALSISVLLTTSCEDLLEVDDPMGQIADDAVFENPTTANAAITSLYAHLRDNAPLVGNSGGLGVLMGLYSDELDYYSTPGSSLEMFFNHQVMPSNDIVKSTWDNAYSLIYKANLAIEKIDKSQSLSTDLKKQLTGEALFIRALTHFYLLQLFGAIPYIESTDYLINQDVIRTQSEEVYGLLVNDLVRAKQMLSIEYPDQERTRANRFAATSLLARIYLYKGDWINAELQASEVIEFSSYYNLETDLDKEFLKESSSAILQLKPLSDGENTKEGGYFLFEQGPPLNVSLNPLFMASFEQEDLRRSHWVKEITDGTTTWFAPFKYKSLENSGTTLEYSVLFRLAELYLIRAEARANSGNLQASADDLNIIRNRAGLADIQNITTSELTTALINERKHELFTEHGHRWFDLKRLGIATDILAPIKPNWRSTDVLFPIPESELLANPNLAPQNPGY
ncbi:RagB/SusD family nutrient uptake outer membrane protein [Moheibacter lacus]|uniref:RagB/SusD family nutrient uptake outer membrane protein n=1 Tax=Moheibacter lacus TaxID=2745851 RepID=A0A838ZS55_9FLAO|nr:RagB/SusD family nutrient uptake outer membrane protein [Moheibacter lacus]MBA5628929.1 RagB/SusD family nutrient uptake outer membrane protein [Moheibacter lacus]